MQKSKAVLAQHKNKSKSPIATTPKKSLTKNKERLTPCSPRANRIHTLEAKASPQIYKKGKNSNEVDSALKSPKASNSNKEKGYQTPKFKCQEAQSNKVLVHQNFFSFGEKQNQKMIVGFKPGRDKQNCPNVKEVNRLRKDQRFR